MAATSGTTGRRGIFLWGLDEWVDVLASYNRSLDWAGATAGLTRRKRMAVVSSTTPWHQSARVGATVQSPWVQTLRIDSGDLLEDILERLDRFQPQARRCGSGRRPPHRGALLHRSPSSRGLGPAAGRSPERCPTSHQR